MILVDASVFVARLKREANWQALYAPLDRSPFAVASITLTEAGLRYVTYTGSSENLSRYGEEIRSLAAEVVPIDADIALAATEAFARFGKGSRHAARLNFGDCLVYAVAKARGLPLLFKGDDFGHTDVATHAASQDDTGRPLKI